MFQQWPQLLAIISVVLTTVFFILVSKYLYHKKYAIIGGLLCGGALGNCIDRVFKGAVIDYIHLTFFPSYPIFNIADMAIVSAVGMGMFIYWQDSKAL